MKNYLKTITVTFISLIMTVACSDNDDGNVSMDADSYNTTFKITDAPIDNANVEAVFVTVSSVKVDGTTLEGFNKTTFDLAALVNGETLTLGNLELEAGSYSNIELELDYITDANGNTPGCYVELVNGEKDQLEATSNTINITDTFEVLVSTSNEIIIDFDLRKTIKEEQGTAANNFEFVSMSELTAGIRTVNNAMAGKIFGSANDPNSTSDKIIVYAYEQGTFDADIETEGQGESNVLFANAVTSSEVSGIDQTYNLSFLKEGDYELVFASYSEEGDDFSFNTLLEAESTTGLNLGAISITSALQISANVTITGTK